MGAFTCRPMIRNEHTLISICIVTFRRPQGLSRLLASLGRLNPQTPPYEVIVVDNDRYRSAEPIVRQFQSTGVNIHYGVEPVQSISRARNKSLVMARGAVVAFIDDDEEADSRWLVELWRGMNASMADAVIGPVLPLFSGKAPRWLREGGFFERPRPPTGTVLNAFQTRTGNCLVRREALADIPGPFAEAYGLTGGEDTHLFLQLETRGCKFIAVDGACVYEHIGPNRCRKRWLIKRRFRIRLNILKLSSQRPSGKQRLLSCTRILLEIIALGLRGVVFFPFMKARGLQSILEASLRTAEFAFMMGVSSYEGYKTP